MIPIERIDHVSMAAESWRDQSARLRALLGFPFPRELGAAEEFTGCVSQVPGTGIEFEILEPKGAGSFVRKFLDAQGPGLHHITVQVSDIQVAAAELERQGITPFGGIVDDGEWDVTYIHPRDSGGILWQLFVPHEPMLPAPASVHGGGAVGLKRFDHVSLAVRDLEKQADWQARVFGMNAKGSWRNEHGGFAGCTMTIPGSQLQFEIIAPTRPDSFVEVFIDRRRQGLHHICCEVQSVEGAVAGLRAKGIEAHGGVAQDWRKHTFLHPRDSGGVLFQLFEEPGKEGAP